MLSILGSFFRCKKKFFLKLLRKRILASENEFKIEDIRLNYFELSLYAIWETIVKNRFMQSFSAKQFEWHARIKYGVSRKTSMRALNGFAASLSFRPDADNPGKNLPLSVPRSHSRPLGWLMVSLYPIPDIIFINRAPLRVSPLRLWEKRARERGRGIRGREAETARKEDEVLSRGRVIIMREEDRNGMRNKVTQKAGELRGFGVVAGRGWRRDRLCGVYAEKRKAPHWYPHWWNRLNSASARSFISPSFSLLLRRSRNTRPTTYEVPWFIFVSFLCLARLTSCLRIFLFIR